MTRLRITANGRIQGLWDDALALDDLGVLHVERASHVEFDVGQQCWCVWPARGRRRALYHSRNRAAALAWEHAYFGPGGPGWQRRRDHPRTLVRTP